jgi:hypothetical protein
MFPRHHHSFQTAPLPPQPQLRPAGQSGAGLVEFSIVAVPILLIGLGSIEVAQWLFNKQAVSLALLEAGRAAITSHASPSVIEAAFEKALLPLFVTSQDGGASHRLHKALNQRSQETGTAPWRIEILSPTPGAFLDFSDPTLNIARQTGLAAINNNYLAEQDQRMRDKNGQNGQGPLSGQSILQANTLELRLTYLHEPVLPGMKSLVRMLGSEGADYARHAMARGGYLPLVQNIRLVMQSHPVNWPLPAHGKVVGPGGLSPTSPIPLSPAATCQGLWCLDHHTAGQPPPLSPESGSGSGQAGSVPSSGEQGQKNGPAVQPGSDKNDISMVEPGKSAVSPDDPACGVALCCTAV